MDLVSKLTAENEMITRNQISQSESAEGDKHLCFFS